MLAPISIKVLYKPILSSLMHTFTTLILSSLNLDLQSAIGASASAIGNIGPAMGQFGPTDNYALLHPIGKWMMTFCMLLGRLEIFTIMILFSRTFWK